MQKIYFNLVRRFRITYLILTACILEFDVVAFLEECILSTAIQLVVNELQIGQRICVVKATNEFESFSSPAAHFSSLHFTYRIILRN